MYKIAVMPGDGTGPEVTVEAVKVLKAAADKFDFKVDLTEFDFGGERYMKTGETLPDSAVEELRGFDSILLGAIGGMIMAGIIGLFVDAVILSMWYKLFGLWLDQEATLGNFRSAAYRPPPKTGTSS